ncbi:MAG: hypothetical protein BWX80_01561 [Candidatus Hydrogenedentes bacterium ADurb.Bin101]|nr:MAG: hypothetical protein BWX80_01561 [Candidatus Hydrogenedentes bacterium ADurb.Bin101]
MPFFFGYADAGIAHLNRRVKAFVGNRCKIAAAKVRTVALKPIGLDCDGALFPGNGFRRIQYQIHDDLLNLAAIRVHFGRFLA